MLPVPEQPLREGYGASGERWGVGSFFISLVLEGAEGTGVGAGWAKRGWETRKAAKTWIPTLHLPPTLDKRSWGEWSFQAPGLGSFGARPVTLGGDSGNA